MTRTKVPAARGFQVGDLLRLSSEIYEIRVTGGNDCTFTVEWPWREIDQASRNRWDGQIGFPRDPNHRNWRNTPWRVEPDGWELSSGDVCLAAIPSADVRVTAIINYDPPEAFGWLPRPSWAPWGFALLNAKKMRKPATSCTRKGTSNRD